MSAPYLVPLRERPDERYGGYCDRMESALLEIIKANDVSLAAIKVLAFIVTEIPADFDYSSQTTAPTVKLRHFLLAQTPEVQKQFFAEAMRLAPYMENRIRTFVSPDILKEAS